MLPRLKRLLFICLCKISVIHCRFNLTISLCKVPGDTVLGEPKLLEDASGRQGKLYIRMGHAPYISIRNKINSLKIEDYPNTVEYPGNLLASNQIEIHYRDRDVMCLEQLTG